MSKISIVYKLLEKNKGKQKEDEKGPFLKKIVSFDEAFPLA